MLGSINPCLIVCLFSVLKILKCESARGKLVQNFVDTFSSLVMCILYLLGLVPLNLETFTSLACRAALAHEGKVPSGKIVFVSCSEQQQAAASLP